ncbi:ABC transporter substrate-binding protein [Yinghuangia sp. ASG 101]|uniref:ABC transporter substrate-binding protein n=1 Tax=Yinghuangia sp. ASG 101 TaxID=2896848 RepID=UPI001E619D80|nr:ABC transporter substrate-binding protein [Yinghuangia sp. ASG 101]UGQ13368.1 ABC transporter substrate-binding protein [Yinghuangia sp. ASG 101]
MRPRRTLVAVLATAALLAAGCSDRGDNSDSESASGSTQQQPAASADFGDLKNVCQAGQSTSAPAQGVTAREINVGVFSDVGFTKKQEFPDAAKVFTAWCNEAGGINGRKLVANIRDSKLLEVRQRMSEACREDFALVGGGAAMDNMGVKDRLSCLLPDFTAQPVSLENGGSDLQVTPQPGGSSYVMYAGYYNWLLKEAYPGSAKAIGVIAGDSPTMKPLTAMADEGVKAVGGAITYSDLYPAAGVSDWTPYAQSIKSKGVKGLLFYGSYSQLAKLEQALTTADYKLDWIDANSNAYGDEFIQLAGEKALTGQNNVADLSGVYPLENAAQNPATQKVVDLFAKYAPGAKVGLGSIRAFSSWLLFAKSAAACGDNLTRKCVYEAALKETAWTGGGLQAPLDLSQSDAPVKCFNVVVASPDGWKPADFKPDNGAYRCDAPAVKLTGDYPKPTTLADVGKSLDDVK